MGATKNAMAQGSINSVYVCAIEGWPTLYTNHGTLSAVLDAWSATDWADQDAQGGLFVDLSNAQQIHPWQPFNGGGTCVLRILGDTGDGLGIAMGKSAPTTARSEMTATVDRDDDEIEVKDADQFENATTYAYIGNECFEYGGKTATSFTSVVRGKFSPFGGGAYDPLRFARHHRVGIPDQFGGTSSPEVTQERTVWEGAWVGVWEHQVLNAETGEIDTKADAQLVFAGQIAGGYGDDPLTGATVIHLEHVLDIVKDTSLLRDQYKAKIDNACSLFTGTAFTAYDALSSAGGKQATPLTVVASGASAPYSILAGTYTPEEIVDVINAWLAQALQDSDLNGRHEFAIVEIDGLRYLERVTTFPAASGSGDNGQTKIMGPSGVVKFLGGETAVTNPLFPAFIVENDQQSGTATEHVVQPNPIKRLGIFAGFDSTFQVVEEQGEFFDNAGIVPASLSQYDNGTDPVGFFLTNDKALLAGRITGGEFIGRLVAQLDQTVGGGIGNIGGTLGTRVEATEITQIVVLGAAWFRLLRKIFASTGTANYNSSDDTLAYGLGLGLPMDLMIGTGSGTLDDDIATMPGNGIDSSVWITKPTKLAELFTTDFLLRGTHLVWKDGAIRFATWQTPNAALSVLDLTEDNKAEPAGNKSNHRTATIVEPAWARPIVKIQFDYDPLADKYASSIVLEDRPALDAQSSKGDPITLQARNIGTGGAAALAIQELVPLFFSRWIPFLSRPLHKMRRSIDQRVYEGYAPGDIITVTDTFARDPATGLRGIEERPGMLLRHTYNPGGRAPGARNVQVQQGEVDVMVMPRNDAALWAPAAEIDETVSGGGFTAGYNNGTKTIRCKAHAHSESSEIADATYFDVGRKIFVTEVDPSGAPLQWSRSVNSQSGNDIELDSVLGGFDSAKRYRVTFTYIDESPQDLTAAFQADEADGLALDDPSFRVYNYGLAGPSIAATEIADSELCELDPTLVSAEDGFPFDTGFHLGMVKSVNNLINHGTAIQGPSLGDAMLWASVGSPEFVLVSLQRRFFGAGQLGVVRRMLTVAPWFRSSSGVSKRVRVTISPNMPVQASDNSVTWTAPYSQVDFASPATTTWGTATEAELDLRYVDARGVCWLGIEVENAAQTRGLAQCRVGPRE